MTPFRIALTCLVLLPGMAFAWPIGNPAPGPNGEPPSDAGTQCEDLSEEPITYGMVYDDPAVSMPGQILDIHDIWGAGGCVGCHNSTAMGGLRLDMPVAGYSSLYFQPSFRNATLLRVLPSEPEQSLLNAMLNCTPPDTFPVMPPPMDAMSQRIPRNLRAMVYDWIQQGARAVDDMGNPISEIVFRDQLESSRLQRNLATPPPP
jgi:hypothetical protein